MPRTRSLKTDGGADIMKTMQSLCGENCDPLSLVCAVGVLVYIGLASPQNTPAFFGSVAFKVVIFAVVIAVTLMDTKIGVIFGLAMVLSVCYSYMRSDVEKFDNHIGEDGGVVGGMPITSNDDANALTDMSEKMPIDAEGDAMEAVNEVATAKAATATESFDNMSYAPYHSA